MRHSRKAAALGALLPLFTPALAQTQAAGNADRGHALFLRDGCYQCHGTVGQGGAAGPRIAPEPPPAIIIQLYIRNPAGQMPPYSAQVASDSDVADIHAYLASVARPPAMDALTGLNGIEVPNGAPGR